MHANDALQGNLYRYPDVNPPSLHRPSLQREEVGEDSSSSSQLFYLQEEIRRLQYRIGEQEKEFQERERKLQRELEEEKQRHEEDIISVVKNAKEELEKTSQQKESTREEGEATRTSGVRGGEKKRGEQGDDHTGDTTTLLSSAGGVSIDEVQKIQEQEDSRQNASSSSASPPSILDLVLAQRERYKAKISQLEEVCQWSCARLQIYTCIGMHFSFIDCGCTYTGGLGFIPGSLGRGGVHGERTKEVEISSGTESLLCEQDEGERRTRGYLCLSPSVAILL